MHDWQRHVEEIAQQVVRIETQSGWGTGFVHYARQAGARCIATARHVIEDVWKKNQSFRVWHGTRAFDYHKDTEDALFVQRTGADIDLTVIAVIEHGLPMPLVPLASPQERQEVRVGMDVGWLGFPALDGVSGQLCFFSGRISLANRRADYFLIDGTAVHGCSGGPVFCVTNDGARIIGALSSYIPNANMSEGGYLPGLSAAVDVSNYKDLEKALDRLPSGERSLEIKLNECPKCGGNLVEHTDANGQPDIVCQSGCGALIDLLDQDFVRNAPGGAARLKGVLIESF